MSIPKDYTIRQITYAMAMQVVVTKHYLHRRCPCTAAFGLFDLTGVLRGVVVYGTPSSSPLRSGLCGPEEAKNVIELTRLWCDDSLPKNCESYLIAHTIRKIPKEIIVSYADTAQAHLGVIYQATNWFYTGLGAKRTSWTVKGVTTHCHTLSDQYTAAEIREKFGADFSLVPRSRKHRYVFFNCGRFRKKELLRKLRYPLLPYPKQEKQTNAPETSTAPRVQTSPQDHGTTAPGQADPAR